MTFHPLDINHSLALLGGGGHASDVLSVVEAFGPPAEPLDNKVYIADDQWENRSRFAGRAVILIDSIDEAATLAPYLLATGYPETRRQIDQRASALGGTAATAVIHPSTDVNTGVTIGAGTVILGGSWLSALATIGRHVYVSTGCTIGHDAQIGDYVSAMPGVRVSGDTNIGEGVMIGSNAVVLPGVTVGAWAKIGAGSVVTRDVEAGATVVGAPAKPR